MEGRTPAIEHYFRALPLQDRLTAHLEEIVRERDPYSAPEGHQYVREYISSRLATSGRVIVHSSTTVDEPTTTWCWTCRDGRIAGSS